MDETMKLDISRYAQLIIENAGDVIWVFDLATAKFKFASPSVYKLRGYTPDEALQQTLQEALTPESYQMVAAALPKRLASFESGDNSVRIQIHEVDQTCKDGSIVPTEIVSTLFQDDQGKVIEIFGVTRDISERKNFIRKLQEKTDDYILLNERIDLATKAANIGIWDCDVIHDHLIWDDGMYKLYGIQKEDFAGTYDAWLARVHPDDRERSHKEAQMALSGEKEYDTVFRIIQPDGSVHFIKAYAQVIRSSEGKPTRVIGVNYDITEQKLTEEALRKTKVTVSEMQEQFRLAFVTNPDSITISNLKDGRFVMVNEGFCQLTGYRLNEVIGKTSYELNIWHNTAERDRLVKKLQQDAMVKNMEVKICFKDGSLHTVLVSASVISLNGEKHLLLIARDIEEIVKTKDELLKAKEKAQKSDRLKTVFLQNMSHEIRTPMNAIMGFANLIPSYFNEKEKLIEFTQIISQRSADLLDIINDILDLSKIETGQLPVRLEPCNLNDMLTELNEFFINHRKKINKESIDIIINPICDPIQSDIITDKVKLKQIFINLIYNAFKFTEKGKIEVGCNIYDKQNMTFYVSDTGIGVPPDKQAIIFERFMQVDGTVNQQGGSGLGLAIVKGLVELLGGTIRVESLRGRGSKFIFSIQYVATKARMNKADLSAEENLSEFSSGNILVVEDDEYSRLYIEEILLGSGLSLHHVSTGKKAVEFVMSNPVDIILMDIRLPEMEGYEATRLIKEKNPQVKIIAQTAYASSNDRQKALDAGCDDYVSKPINKHLLLTKISSFLREGAKID